MKIPKRITSLSIMLIAASIIAWFYFSKSQQLSYELNEMKTQRDSRLELGEVLSPLNRFDSLLINENYREAALLLQNQIDTSTNGLKPLLEMQLRLTRQLQNKRVTAVMKVDSSAKDSTVVVERSMTPLEVRQFDSLQFALLKANTQINNLQRQLRQKTAGEYLTFTTAKGTQVHYVGQVVNNMANGKGIALLSTGSRYDGDWRNNKRHGTGKFYWPDGQMYEGEYREDKRFGMGTYQWPNGEKFTGQWKNDQRNGEGVFYGPDGEVVAKGTWKNDELVKVEK